MNEERLGMTARPARHVDRWIGVAVSLLMGLTMVYGSTSCSPSPALGSTCAAAGGTCDLGGAGCVKEAASSAQDCNTNPPNPGGGVCCLEFQEGGIPGATPTCSPVLASDYDQSCTVDTDCVAVGEISSCPASGCDGCTTEAVNKSVMAQYTAAFAQAFASGPSGPGCNCPCESGAVCRGGKCQAAFCGPPLTDTLSACADAGGQCAYSANTTCSGMGPPDACAYSDEFCCLN
jgi:hypothetical protein